MYDELERQFLSTLGAVEVLEAQVGSFNYQSSAVDPMRSNPFAKPSGTSARSQSMIDPWDSSGTKSHATEPQTINHDGPVFTEQRNPFLPSESSPNMEGLNETASDDISRQKDVKKNAASRKCTKDDVGHIKKDCKEERPVVRGRNNGSTR